MQSFYSGCVSGKLPTHWQHMLDRGADGSDARATRSELCPVCCRATEPSITHLDGVRLEAALRCIWVVEVAIQSILRVTAPEAPLERVWDLLPSDAAKQGCHVPGWLPKPELQACLKFRFCSNRSTSFPCDSSASSIACLLARGFSRCSSSSLGSRAGAMLGGLLRISSSSDPIRPSDVAYASRSSLGRIASDKQPFIEPTVENACWENVYGMMSRLQNFVSCIRTNRGKRKYCM